MIDELGNETKRAQHGFTEHKARILVGGPPGPPGRAWLSNNLRRIPPKEIRARCKRLTVHPGSLARPGLSLLSLSPSISSLSVGFALMKWRAIRLALEVRASVPPSANT